jgi:cell division FtsZ-interacting protein ZapD
MLALVLLATVALTASGEGLNDAIKFRWETNEQTGFTDREQEVERFKVINIDVDRDKLAAAAARRLNVAGGEELTNRILFLREAVQAFAQAQQTTLPLLRRETDALTAAIAGGNDQEIRSARSAVQQTAAAMAAALLPAFDTLEDNRAQFPELYDKLATAVLADDGYGRMAQVLQQELDTVTAELQKRLQNQVQLALAATLAPPDDAQRSLALRPYNEVEQLAADAVPSPFPVIDDRTRRELQAAQQFRDVLADLGKVNEELRKSLDQLQQQLNQLRSELQVDVLQKNLDQLEQTARQQAGAEPIVQQIRTTRAFVANLTGSSLQLTGSTDADRLLFLATSLSQQADALANAVRDLPNALEQLAKSLENDVQLAAKQTVKDAVTTLRSNAKMFLDKQEFFNGLVKNVLALASQFRRAATVVRSSESLAAAARSIQEADLNTQIQLARIAGDVHVGDRVIVDAALYQVDPATGKRTTLDEQTQKFVIQRYGLFADNIRGGLLFVEPRSKIPRDVHYQPVPALGYYWRTGIRGRARLNAALPSLGFTVGLLDFEDANELELGVAAGVSLFDLVWTGYGRNLQARANYFYVGVNPLYFARFFQKSRGE